MIDLRGILSQRGIVPRGVIHIGAHEGEEVEEYKSLGAENILLIEANPQVYSKLAARVGHLPGVRGVNCAIANHDGVAILRVTSGSQSSSLLPLKLHSRLYPDIVETKQIQVPCRRLDTLISELNVDPTAFNIIHLDIQGAEMMALSGARRQMIWADLIRTEVNLAELYEGCPLLDEMDRFMTSCGYERTALATPYHPTWGDAVYLGKPVITCSTMATDGRWANQLFRYMFLKIYANQHGLELQLPRWDGTDVFGANDPPVAHSFPVVSETPGENALDAPRLTRVDLVGYFQFHTSHYAPHRDYIRLLFVPTGEYAAAGNAAVEALRQRGKTIVAVHLRRGDYRNIPGHEWMYVPPNEWYVKWLRDVWSTLDQPVLYIASDEPENVVGDFAVFGPVTQQDLSVEAVGAPYFIDYQVLRNADRIAISNSTFSFHACMLNDVAGAQFVRPNRTSSSLVPFDPWNDDPLWKMPKG